MEKYAVIIILFALFALSITGCKLNDSGQSTSNLNCSSSSSKGTEVEKWKYAYTSFLREIPVMSDDKMVSFTLRDLDNNQVPELIVIQEDENAMNATLTVYSYDGSVFEIGNYSNTKKSFLGGFRISNNSEYPGLFECWWGGSVDHYGYLSIKEGKLEYEHVWNYDRTIDPPVQEKISNDKTLIIESMNAFRSYDFTDNLLEMHPINNNNIDELIDKILSNLE